jgi:4-diphosphocytidyl-2-C-methyl-D-erythritol kinase
MIPLRVQAPAKLNLSLSVTGRRADGYHTLATELVLLDLADNLLLMPGCSGLRVEALPGDDVPRTPAGNLAWRGLVAGLAGEPQLACLALEKRVPSAAGLGGGSSDAAAGWRLARRSRGEPDAADDPAVLAALSRIGADVPFFAAGIAAARVRGIGEVVEPVKPPTDGDEVVLVHPPFRLSTAAVFAELRPDEWSGAAAEAGNDLLGPARRLRPELDDVMRLVVGAGAEPRLTGSGPTIFARGDDPERADAVAARLGRAGLRTTRTRLRREPARIEAVTDEEEAG